MLLILLPRSVQIHVLVLLLLVILVTVSVSVSAEDTINDQQYITGIRLYNSQTDTVIQTLNNDDVLDLITLEANDHTDITIRVLVARDTIPVISGIRFNLNDGATIRVDGVAPYYLGGDNVGDAYSVNSIKEIGMHTLYVAAYTNGTFADVIDELTMTFRTIADAASASMPTVAPVDQYDVEPYDVSAFGAVNGELKLYHKITFGFAGVLTGITNNILNPFTYYRVDMNITHVETGHIYIIPGYYAADGNGPNGDGTSVGQYGISGSAWLVHFRPLHIGTYDWLVSYTEGEMCAIYNNGTSASFFDGRTGSITVADTDKTGRDFRSKGMLRYVGEHHLQYSNGVDWFLKAGADSPENLLAYESFATTPNNGGYRKSYEPHANDYEPGNPTWDNGKGKNIMGALNYLSSVGVNSISFLTMNIDGDDQNVYPYPDPDTFDRIAVSKVSQWDIVFDHAESLGLFLHVKTQENENDDLLDNVNDDDDCVSFGTNRKFYYRELVARIGHHLGLLWNIGEENSNSAEQQEAFAAYMKDLDPYDHPIVIHTLPNQHDDVYTPLLGSTSNYDGVSLQLPPGSVFNETLKWVEASASANHKWLVGHDEQQGSFVGVVPDSEDPTHNTIRQKSLYGNLFAGGCGVEWYFGYNYTDSDLTLQDFRSRANMWNQSAIALDFFSKIPYWRMISQSDRITNDGWCLFERDNKQDNVACYLMNGGTADIDLTSMGGDDTTYTIKWFTPLLGGDLLDGTVKQIPGNQNSSLGEAPFRQDSQDWLLLITNDQPGTVAATPNPTATPTTTAPVTTAPSKSPVTSAPSTVPVTAAPSSIAPVTNFPSTKVEDTSNDNKSAGTTSTTTDVTSQLEPNGGSDQQSTNENDTIESSSSIIMRWYYPIHTFFTAFLVAIFLW